MMRFGMFPALVLVLAGCSGNGEATTKVAGHPPVAVEAIKVVPSSLNETVEVVGSLAPKFQADVKSEYAGLVKEVYVTEWVKVKKGDKLAVLDNRESQASLNKAKAAVEVARANVLQAQVSLSRADREHNRLLKLKESGLATQQGLDESITEKQAASARLVAVKAQVDNAQQEYNQTIARNAKTVIYAPMDGVVSFRGVNVGDLVGEMGSPKVMFKIVSNKLLDLTFTVPSRKMGAIKVGQPLDFTSDAFPGRKFTGKVMFINPMVDETDRSLKVIAEVPNDPEVLKGGLFVKGHILTGVKQNVLLLPKSTLFSWDLATDKAQLWVALADTADRRRVTTGLVQGDLVEITDGLKPGELVITRGGYNLKDGDRIKQAAVKGE
ncbi:MAG: efflux RND transporter periplasmic adaptor subunit [Deltaproteobacteria bacterium]|nr:efflux RND transporter periplasmic adaptor subunit [Deltaproteobacteria bacterium]